MTTHKNVNVSQAEAIRVIEYAIISGEHFYFPFRWEDSREYFFMLEAYWKATITKRDEFATLIWSALLCEQRLKRNWGRNFLDPKLLESIMKAELPGFICKRESEAEAKISLSSRCQLFACEIWNMYHNRRERLRGGRINCENLRVGIVYDFTKETRFS